MKPEWIDHVVFGNVLQTSADAIYGARHVGLKAGVPIEVPALTVNRLCGSGIQAAVSGAQMIQLDEADIVLTGGIESMSQAPHVIRGLRTGLRLGQGELEDRCGKRCSTRTAAAPWRRPRRTAPRSTASRARSRTRTRSAASSSRRRPGTKAVRGGGRAGRDQDAQGRRASSRRTITCGPTRRSKGSRNCRPRFRKNGMRDGRQRQRHRRRRRRADARVGAGRRAARAEAARPDCCAGRRSASSRR